MAERTKIMADKFAITGTLARRNHWYVDPGAATAEADGSAQNPFRTVEEVLALLPDPTTPVLAAIDTIEICGHFDSITLDRSCVLKGPAVIDELIITDDLVMVRDCYVSELTVTDAENCIIQGCLGLTTVTLDDSIVEIHQSTIGEIVLEGAGTLALNVCTVLDASTIPAEWDVTAYNSVLTDVTGTYTDYNCEEIPAET
jgi:hypothetical protein